LNRNSSQRIKSRY